MAKLYFNGSEVTLNKALSKELLNLVERGMARSENQASFRSFYDIEIMGVTVYYKKKWNYEDLTQQQIEKAAEAVGVGSRKAVS